MKNIAKYKEPIAASLLLAFSIGYFLMSFTVRGATGSDVGSAFVPRILALLLGALSVVYLVSSIARVRKAGVESGVEGAEEQNSEARALARKNNVTVALSIALLGLYVFTLEPLGFIVATIIYLFLQIMALGEKGRRMPMKAAIIAVCTSLAVYFTFVSGLKLMLPRGVLDFLRF